jgi:tetratricopeptide (TPR) repeat protein
MRPVAEAIILPRSAVPIVSREKKNKEKVPAPTGRAFKHLPLLLVAGLCAAFYVHARHFEFIQDDSFITFRYIRNLVQGHGLVWNIGERVEGYTTFLWTILLAIPAYLGIDLITASQWLGVAFGIAVIYFMFRMTHVLHPGTEQPLFALVGGAFFAANSAAAYWSISGMETSMFAFLLLLGCLFFLRERFAPAGFGYTPLIFVLLSLTRPEGMFLFGLAMLFYLVEVLRGKEISRPAGIKRIVVWSLMYAIPIGLFMAWRLSYYGYLFPNTYYAKAGISAEYFAAGIEYLQTFASTYLTWGLLMLLPVFALLRRGWKSALLFPAYIVLAYTGYIVTVGGDVLPAFRFFIPILPLVYLLVQEGIREVYVLAKKNADILGMAVLAGAGLLLYLTYSGPYEYVREYWTRENGLVAKMTETGNWLKRHASPNTVIAASTIGAIGYYSDVTLVDMLGLTDETIAHEPEKIFGVKSGWRERNYNVTYVLGRKPDYILFSTGIKPSAFAERALFTHQEFRRSYYPYYYHPTGDAGFVDILYRRSEEMLPEVAVPATVNNDFINQFYDGMNRSRRWPDEAVEYFRKAIALGPPDFPLVYQELGGIAYRAGKMNDAVRYYQRAIDIDPRMVESRIMLGVVARERKDLAGAISHFTALTKYVPEYTMSWTLLGETYLMLENRSAAHAAFERALAVAENNQDAYRYLQQLDSQR